MNLSSFLIGLLAGAGGGVVGALVVTQTRPAPEADHTTTVLDAPHVETDSADEAARADLEELRLELASLRSTVDALRSQVHRRPAPAPADGDDGIAAAEEASVELPKDLSDLSGEDREAVLTLIEEAREQRRQEQRVEREARRAEWTLERATQIANELSLPAGSEQRLGEIMLERNAQFSAMRNELNDLGWGRETRELMRERAEEINASYAQSLSSSFGPTTADQIQELELGERRRGPGGPGGPDGDDD